MPPLAAAVIISAHCAPSLFCPAFHGEVFFSLHAEQSIHSLLNQFPCCIKSAGWPMYQNTSAKLTDRTIETRNHTTNFKTSATIECFKSTSDFLLVLGLLPFQTPQWIIPRSHRFADIKAGPFGSKNYANSMGVNDLILVLSVVSFFISSFKKES